MRAVFRVVAIISLIPVGISAVENAAGSTVARTSVVASADVRTRTSIVASTELLRFQVAEENQPAIATLTFSAGARAAATSEVLLLVTADEPLESTASTDEEIALTMSSGASARPVIAGERVLAATWIGGGLRTGQLQFELRATPGTYSVPVKLQLIVP